MFISSLLLSGMIGNMIYFELGSILTLIFITFSMSYLYISPKKIKLWWKGLSKYKLTNEEYKLFSLIERKANDGYIEWFAKTQGDDICGPWITNITTEEIALIDKIHAKFYGKNWWISTPIGVAQCAYIMFKDIEDKVIYKNN